MGKCLKLYTLLLGAALIFGCATQKNGRATAELSNVEHLRQDQQTSLPEHDPATGQKLVKKAHSAIGTPYVLGGSAPGGFDCSGLVKWTYNSIGVELPRTAREQSTVGQKIKNVEDMRAGDIVAFKHPKRGYHTGIYVGDGKFIHSPRKRTRVRINSLDDPYFSSTLLGARRVNVSSADTLVAQAESRLREFLSQKGRNIVMDENTNVAMNDKYSTATNVAKKTSRSAAASSVQQKNGKNSKAVKPQAKSSKAGKQTAKQPAGKTKTTAKAANQKNSKSATKAVSKTGTKPAIKTVAAKAAATKKSNKEISMLQLKKTKVRTGKHS